MHPYVLLNFKGNYSGVSTVAHEMGHAMQSHFANTTQPPVYGDYPMFTAEVASTAAEIVFKQQILSQTTDKRQRALMIDRMLDDIRQTVFRQTRFAEFDLVFHEMAEKGEPMTAEAVMAKSRAIFQKYYGPELVLDPEADVECLRVPHHYYNFYVYRYADSYSRGRHDRQTDHGRGARRRGRLDEVPQDRQQHVRHRHAQNRRRRHDHAPAGRRLHGPVRRPDGPAGSPARRTVARLSEPGRGHVAGG